ncbi:MAG TPA: hypothetical protein VGG54_23040 [Trebonia sp.]
MSAQAARRLSVVLPESTLPGAGGLAHDRQVSRMRAFIAEHADAEFDLKSDLPFLHCLVTIRGARRHARRVDLRVLMDELERLDREAAEADAIEAEFPGWRVWESSPHGGREPGRWYAVRQGTRVGDPRPMTIDGADLRALRSQLAALAR